MLDDWVGPLADREKVDRALDAPLGPELDRWGEGRTDAERASLAAATAQAPARRAAQASSPPVVGRTRAEALEAARRAQGPSGGAPAAGG